MVGKQYSFSVYQNSARKLAPPLIFRAQTAIVFAYVVFRDRVWAARQKLPNRVRVERQQH
jgi:hypothetical protein